MGCAGATFAPGKERRDGMRWPAQRHRVLSGCKDGLSAGLPIAAQEKGLL